MRMANDSRARPRPAPHTDPGPAPGPAPAGVSAEPDWDLAIADFRRRRVDTLQSHLLQRTRAVGGLGRIFRAVSGAQRTALLEEAFRHPPPGPTGRLTLALYILCLARQQWEASTAWETIDDVLTRADAAARAHRAEPDGDATLLVTGYGRVVKRAMQVENALNCSCPLDLEDHAALASAAATDALERAEALPPELRGPLSLLRAIARTDRDYFAAVRDIGRAMQAVLGHHDDAPSTVEATLDHLATTVDSPVLRDDVFATELRTHAGTLRAFLHHRSDPWLHVGSAKVVYCYPFTLPGDPVEHCRRASATCADMRLAGAPPDHAAETTLSDFWDAADPGGRGYSGVSLHLDPVVVLTADRPRPRRLQLAAEVRLSRLGNHHLRFELRLADADLHTINQSLRRPSGSTGLERLVIGGTERRTRLLDHAAAVVDDLIHHLLGRPADRDPADDAARAAARARRRGELDRTVHVVVSIRQLFVASPDGRRVPADGRALVDDGILGASLLTQSVRQTASGLEEWIRYPASGDIHTARVGEAFSGDVVLRTANTTVICMTGTPDFVVRQYEEGAEFIASLAVLYARWSRDVSDAVQAAEAEIEQDPRARAAVQHKRLALSRRIRSIHSMLALIRSPLFCKTATARQYLDSLHLHAGLPGLEAALRAELDDAAAAYDEMATVLVDVERAREEAARRNVERVLATIAAVSLADLFGLFNPDPLPLVAGGLELAAMVTLGLVIIVLARR
jgi:hypothetical protein